MVTTLRVPMAAARSMLDLTEVDADASEARACGRERNSRRILVEGGGGRQKKSAEHQSGVAFAGRGDSGRRL